MWANNKVQHEPAVMRTTSTFLRLFDRQLSTQSRPCGQAHARLCQRFIPLRTPNRTASQNKNVSRKSDFCMSSMPINPPRRDTEPRGEVARESTRYAKGHPAATKVQPAWQSSVPGITTSTSRGTKLENRAAKRATKQYRMIFFIVFLIAADFSAPDRFWPNPAFHVSLAGCPA